MPPAASVALDLDRRRVPPPSTAPRPAPPRFRLSAAQIAIVEDTLAALRERFRKDGGDLALDHVEDNTIFVRMSGTCGDCQLAAVFVLGEQARLIETLRMPARVVPVTEEL